jgi:purine-binding chemotaxis protein CheW
MMSKTLINEFETAKPGDVDEERQLVALHLGDEVYGVDIAHIHTIITPQPITKVPKSPEFVKGVMNLRGRILPVIDLRNRFGLPPLEVDKNKSVRIVIVDVEGLTAGLIVDAVSEVLRLSASAIDSPSRLVASVDTECITGIGRITSFSRNGEKAEERLIILLDVYKTLTACSKDADLLKKLNKAA